MWPMHKKDPTSYKSPSGLSKQLWKKVDFVRVVSRLLSGEVD